MLGLDGAVDFEEAAGIAPAVLDRGDAEVAARATVHFKLGGGGDPTDVRLEANPVTFDGSAPCCPDKTRSTVLWFHAGSGLEIDPAADGHLLQAVVAEVSGYGKRRPAEAVAPPRAVAGKPG